MNEADGITANNSVATGPNGTLTNGPTWSTGSGVCVCQLAQDGREQQRIRRVW
jgi:hypothetical protein